MNSRTLPCLCKLLTCVIVLAAGAFAAQDRIVEPLNNNQVTSVPGTAHPLAKPDYDQGPVDGSMKLEGLSMHFSPSAEQQAELDELLKEQQTPGSPNYHQWLTQQEYADRFGMSQADINKVTAWLTSQGFTVIDVATSRNTIRFSGTAALVQKAFHVQLHRYLIKGEMHFANPTNVQLPSAFASTVSHIGGLHDFRPKPHIRRAPGAHAASAKPEFTSGQTGNTYVAPGDFAVIYDVKPLYTAGYTGTGMQIAVVGQTAIYPADLNAFRSAAGLSAANFTPICIEGSSSQYCQGSNQYSQNDMTEADLDVEWSGAVAQNATINFIYAGGQDPNVGVFSALQYAIQTYTVSGKVVPIISISYGNCEANLGTSTLNTLQQLVQQAVSQGQTVIAAAGDEGAADCEDATATQAVKGLAVDAPGSIPEVTSMGGSEFSGDQSSSSTYWSSNGSNDVITSAISYIPEEAWNDTNTSANQQNGGALSAGGGGVSSVFNQPTWQDWVTPTGFSGTPMRFVPDMSLNASPYHDGYLICSQIYNSSNTPEGTSCTSGFRYSDGSLYVVGGTSAAAPSFAGILALIEQKANTSFGNLNQAIYTVAQNSTAYGSTATSPAFHDITQGNNVVPCVSGTPNCPSGTTEIGYSAGAGYDLATGLGSIDANVLATDLIANESASATTITLTLSPASNITAGQSVTATATVTSSGGSTPAGTVNFLLNGSSVASVTLSAAGAAQTTVTFTTVGNNTLVAAFSSNNLAFQSSSASQSVSVANAAGAASTSTSVTANPSSFAQGTAFTLTATVSSSTSGTISGNVVFTVGSTTLGTVTLAGSPATATLNVTASQSAALAVGTETITAAYQGSSSFANSSGSTQVTVTAAPSVTLSATNVTIGSTNNGASGTSTITATSTNGFVGTVDFTNATFSVTPNTINANASIATQTLTLTSGQSVTDLLTITLSSSGSARPGRGHMLRRVAGATRRAANHPLGYGGGALMLTAAGLFAIPRRRRLLACLLTLATIALIAGAAACGGGSSNSGTVAATYQVTVGNIVVTNSSTQAQTTTSTSFMLTVQ